MLGMTVEEMLQKMSSSELTEWIAYLKIRGKAIEDALNA